jgi:hypothetical protein
VTTTRRCTTRCASGSPATASRPRGRRGRTARWSRSTSDPQPRRASRIRNGGGGELAPPYRSRHSREAPPPSPSCPCRTGPGVVRRPLGPAGSAAEQIRPHRGRVPALHTGGQEHSCSAGTPRNAWSTCLPHPRQVTLPQRRQVAALHIDDTKPEPGTATTEPAVPHHKRGCSKPPPGGRCGQAAGSRSSMVTWRHLQRRRRRYRSRAGPGCRGRGHTASSSADRRARRPPARPAAALRRPARR